MNIIKRNRSFIILLSLIVIIAYSAASICFLLFAKNLIESNPNEIILHSVISSLLVVIIAAYHLSTLLRRRKRRTDQQKLSRAKYIRAKHRHM
jgi:hypothetical protein